MTSYVLGLEIGVATLGWAALHVDDNGTPTSILALGARKFPAGTIGDIQSGRDASRNERRRLARARRVQLRRRIARLRAVWQLLQGARLLPAGGFHKRDGILKQLDSEGEALSPYHLRAIAIDRKLLPHEIGRIIYHMAQRRGFESNKKAIAGASEEEQEELGVVKKAIVDLEQSMQTSGARTLGEHLANLPQNVRLRARWTSRAMYRQEFARIWDMQSNFHKAKLTPGLRAHLEDALFSQRELQSQKSRVGRCELERSKRRAPIADLDSQEFRMLQRINDLRLVDDFGGEPVELSAEKRAKLLELLEDGDATYAAVRKAIAAPKSVRFNAERVDAKKLLGNRTSGTVRKVVDDAWWNALGRERQGELVRDLISIGEPNGLERRLMEHWGLSAEVASQLADTPLEAGYCAHSRRALMKLLPLMREGMGYTDACKKLYGKASRRRTVTASTFLPPVHSVYRELTNPLVRRALGEVRSVVNELIRRHGKPQAIRVSLLRELRIGRDAREKAHAANRMRNRERAKVAEQLLKDLGVQEAPPWMVDKVLLAEEANWTCPYTGKHINMRSLINDAQFDVVHIVPLHQSLDDSYGNKTLCHVSVRTQPKAMREVSEKAVERFEAFKGFFAKEKAMRVRLTGEEIAKRYSGEVVAGRFVDSCYAAKLLADYVGMLYEPGTSPYPVSCTRGPITSFVREACGLKRTTISHGNHKRHALDAAAVAISGPEIVAKLSDAALRAMPGRYRLASEVVKPWPRFTEDVQEAAEAVIVSSRLDRRARGPLHEETFYRHTIDEETQKPVFSVRKHLWQLTTSDLGAIVNPKERERIIAKVDELGGGDPRKLFVDPSHLPVVAGCVQRAVRVKRNEAAFAIGSNGSTRYVTNEENHHAAIFIKPNGKADREIVSSFEAQRRRSRKEPIVKFAEGVKPIMTLAVGDTVYFPKEQRYRTVRSVSKDPRIVFVELDDGRLFTDIVAAKEHVRMSVEQLRMAQIQKVVVGPLGDVRDAKD